MQKPTVSRRQFLSAGAALSFSSSQSWAALSNLQLTLAHSEQSEDYKALVCVFLLGGNDAFNTLVPRDLNAYQEYADSRQNLAIPHRSLLPIEAQNQAYHEFGLHPKLTQVQKLYRQGTLAFVANVGALIEPVTKAAYEQHKVELPPQLFSHNSQQEYLQSLQVNKPQSGWVGRAADVLQDMNENRRLSMNISLSGSNLWQNGNQVLPFSIDPEEVVALKHLNRQSENPRVRARLAAYERILKQQHEHLVVNEYARAKAKAWSVSEELKLALEQREPLNTVFPEDNELATALQMVARVISARKSLGLKRQTFFIGMRDYDTHANQLLRHPVLMAKLDSALNAFYAATKELGLADKVTTFTQSEFGRTLTSNGDGTDHGWGSHQLVMGGAVKGAEIYGRMPGFYLGSNEEIGEGRIIPTTSADQLSAKLAAWFGLGPGAMAEVFPNLKNFNTADLDFMRT